VVDLGSVEVLVATISVVGFLIFFSSPTAIAIVSQAAAARGRYSSGAMTEVELLAEQAAEISDDGALALYFAKAFTSERAVKTVFLISALFGAAALGDLLSVIVELFSIIVYGVALVDVILSVSVALLFLAVATALFGMWMLTRGAIDALDNERKRLVGRIAEFKKP
jgi:hypothetical protein